MFNIRYKKDLIAYEISIAEAGTIYSGINDIVQSGTLYLDTGFGMGAGIHQQVLGVDCPLTGQLFDVTFLDQSGVATTRVNAICIFEEVGSVPHRRHFDQNDFSYGGVGSTFLVVRAVVPVFNYDYVIDHIFHQNGAMEIRTATVGYLQSNFWSPELNSDINQFGQRIHYYSPGTNHDHYLNFKIDLDVHGKALHIFIIFVSLSLYLIGKMNCLKKSVLTSVKATPQDIKYYY